MRQKIVSIAAQRNTNLNAAACQINVHFCKLFVRVDKIDTQRHAALVAKKSPHITAGWQILK